MIGCWYKEAADQSRHACWQHICLLGASNNLLVCQILLLENTFNKVLRSMELKLKIELLVNLFISF